MITATAGIQQLASELERALALLPQRMIAVVHVKQQDGGLTLSECDVWFVRGGRNPIWSRHRKLPAGLGLTMRQVEHAVLATGHDFVRTDLGLRGAWLRARADAYLLRLRRA